MTEVDMVRVLPGEFVMGRPGSSSGSYRCFTVRHTKGFMLGRYPVTQQQWLDVMGTRPWDGLDSLRGFRAGDRFPVVNVTWHDAMAFCARLSERTGKPYRLPTEAEWEYALRAGTRTKYFWGEEPSAYEQYAWCADLLDVTSVPQLMEVGLLRPNPWGFYDMAGNVQEWVLDLCRLQPYSPLIDKGHYPRRCTLDFVCLNGTHGIVRNCGYSSSVFCADSTMKKLRSLDERHLDLGFRVVLDEEHRVSLADVRVVSEEEAAPPPLRYASLGIFWDKLSDSSSPEFHENVRTVVRYLEQIAAMEADGSLTGSEKRLLAQMKAKKNLKKMISEARAYKEMAEEYANDVKAEKADLDTLGEAILALRRMVSDAGKDQ